MSDSSKPKQPPSTGRVVHFYRPGTPATEPLAAVIASVLPPPNDLDGTVTLCVFDPVRGVHFETVLYSEQPAPGRWSWPPYVAPAIVDQQPMATPETPKPAAPEAPKANKA